jgi:hypothetical protein
MKTDTGTAPTARIDAWMPRWDAVERHETRVRAAPDRVWRELTELDFGRSPVVGVLMGLRRIPALLSRGAPKLGGSRLADLAGSGFTLLETDEGREMVLGIVGRFWRPTSGVERVTAEEFAAWDRPGFARATWNVTLAPDGAGTRVATETRILCTDEASRRAFLRYWRVIRPFSGLIRLEMLRLLRNAAES